MRCFSSHLCSVTLIDVSSGWMKMHIKDWELWVILSIFQNALSWEASARACKPAAHPHLSLSPAGSSRCLWRKGRGLAKPACSLSWFLETKGTKMLAIWDIELIIKLSILFVGLNDRKLNGKLTAFFCYSRQWQISIHRILNLHE